MGWSTTPRRFCGEGVVDRTLVAMSSPVAVPVGDEPKKKKKKTIDKGAAATHLPPRRASPHPHAPLQHAEKEAARSKRRRRQYKAKVDSDLEEARGQAASLWHYTQGKEEARVREMQDELGQLHERLCRMPKKNDEFDTIGGKYRELYVPPEDGKDEFFESEPNYKLWFDVEKRQTRAFSDLPPTLDLRAVVNDGLRDCHASAKEYFGTIPYVLHNTGIIYAQVTHALECMPYPMPPSHLRACAPARSLAPTVWWATASRCTWT